MRPLSIAQKALYRALQRYVLGTNGSQLSASIVRYLDTTQRVVQVPLWALFFQKEHPLQSWSQFSLMTGKQYRGGDVVPTGGSLSQPELLLQVL